MKASGPDQPAATAAWKTRLNGAINEGSTKDVTVGAAIRNLFLEIGSTEVARNVLNSQ